MLLLVKYGINLNIFKNNVVFNIVIFIRGPVSFILTMHKEVIKIYKKLIFIKPEQKEALDEITDTINRNGGYVSVMRLVQDSIQIFIDHYKNDAISKYSSTYEKNWL